MGALSTGFNITSQEQLSRSNNQFSYRIAAAARAHPPSIDTALLSAASVLSLPPALFSLDPRLCFFHALATLYNQNLLAELPPATTHCLLPSRKPKGLTQLPHRQRSTCRATPALTTTRPHDCPCEARRCAAPPPPIPCSLHHPRSSAQSLDRRCAQDAHRKSDNL